MCRDMMRLRSRDEAMWWAGKRGLSQPVAREMDLNGRFPRRHVHCTQLRTPARAHLLVCIA